MSEPWEGVVAIPEGREGDYAIEHFTRPAGEVERSSLRTAFHAGQADKSLVFNHETRWHRLTESGGTWMTDLPIEQVQHDQALAPVIEQGGSVLVGGLGVGYAANILAAAKHVNRVVVVELSSEVVKLVGPHVKDPDGKVEIVNADLFDFLKQNNEGEQESFDWGFYDIWQSDGEGTFHKTVVPLRALSNEHVGEVICWNEGVMRGQLCQNLHSLWLFVSAVRGGTLNEAAQTIWSKNTPTIEQLCTREDGKAALYCNWSVPFWEAVRDGIVTDENFSKAAGTYAGTYGHEGFDSWWRRVREGKQDL